MTAKDEYESRYARKRLQRPPQSNRPAGPSKPHLLYLIAALCLTLLILIRTQITNFISTIPCLDSSYRFSTPANEQDFLDGLSSKSIEKTVRQYTSKSHLAGTSADKNTAFTIQQNWEDLLNLQRKGNLHVYDAGTKSSRTMLQYHKRHFYKPRVWTDRYYPLVTFPGTKSSLTLLNQSSTINNNSSSKVIYKATLFENAYEIDPTAINGSTNYPAFHGYSYAGTAQGELIYANYGRQEDFERLQSEGISITNRIVIVRYSKIFRGLKVSLAEKFGAKGVIIYTDPAEDRGEATDNNEQNRPYPYGPDREPSSIQRGSVENLAYIPGDPLTPFKPAYKNSKRIKTKPLNMPGIPSLPISWLDAQALLKSLDGKGSCFGDDWIGFGGFGYCTGPIDSGNTIVKIVNDVSHNVTAIWNTYALIPGQIKDEVVMIGNHRDAWIFGAADPNSGTAVMTEILKSFGKLLKTGWRPRRTILFASWDGEELGLIGSTEFVEDYQKWIKKNVVVYLNTDIAAAGSRLDISASPSLASVFLDNLPKIKDPDNPELTLQDRFIAQQSITSTIKNLTIGPLGSGSDFTPFLQHVGIASSDVGFGPNPGDPVYHYHSIYDSTYWMENFGDPGYKRHLSVTQLLGLVLLNFTDSKILPINLEAYGQALTKYIHDLPPLQGLNLDKLKKSVGSLRHSISRLVPGKKSVWKYNKILSRFENGFIHKDGLKGRPWYRNLVIAPGINLGYGATPLPGLNEAITIEKNKNRAIEELERLVKIFDRIRDRLDKFN